MKTGALALLMLAAACHRGPAEVTLDADADARNATEAKINADLLAADAAARAPMPRQASHPAPAPTEEQPARRPTTPTADATPADANDTR